MIQQAYKSVRGMFSQVDPSNKDSDLSPSDKHVEIEQPTEDERDLVALVKTRFTSASASRGVSVS